MFPDWKERKRELLDKSDYFGITQNPITAKWTRHLVNQVELRVPSAFLEKDFRDTLETFKSEFAKGDELRTRRFDSIASTIFTAVGKGKMNKEIGVILPIMQELG